jgi:hypothetical protein
MSPVKALETSRQAGRVYYDRWKRMQQEGRQPLVISKRRDPDAWRRWRSYFSANALWLPLDLMNDGRTEMTVPCLDPIELAPAPKPDKRVKDD